MIDNKALLFGVDPKRFDVEIKDNLKHNISGSVSERLSGLLALDFANRLKSSPQLAEYIQLVVSRLKKYLGHQVITDDSFSTSMLLFTVAITPEMNREMDQSAKEQEQEQSMDAAIEAVILEKFGQLSVDEMAMIKDVLKEISQEKDFRGVMEFINNDPVFFKELVINTMRKKKQKKEIAQFIDQHIQLLVQKQQRISKSKFNLRSVAYKLALSVSVVTVASVGMLVGSLVLPALIVPAIAVTTRLASKAAEKGGELMIKNSKSIRLDTQEMEQLRSETKALSIEKVQDKSKSVSHGKSVDISREMKKNKAISKSKEMSKAKGRSISM